MNRLRNLIGWIASRPMVWDRDRRPMGLRGALVFAVIAHAVVIIPIVVIVIQKYLIK